MLRRLAGKKPKRDYVNACTPCADLQRTSQCNTMCCRNFLVPIAQEDLDDGLRPEPPFVDVLVRAPSGACAHFDDVTGHCGVWERRPLACRVYDCRDDLRLSFFKGFVHAPGEPLRREVPERCASCLAPLQLAWGCRDECDGLSVCVACGAGHHVTFAYGLRSLTITFAAEVTPRQRRVYLARSLIYRERWTEALAAFDALLAAGDDQVEYRIGRAVALAELGRIEDARSELMRIALEAPEAQLELAWIDERAGRYEAARERLASAFDQLSEAGKIRATVMFGRISRAEADEVGAALWFSRAILASRQGHRRNDLIKEYLLELLHGGAESRRAVEQALLLASRR